MKIDDIKNLYEDSKQELEVADVKYYVLGKLVEVLTAAEKKYSSLLSEIANLENWIEDHKTEEHKASIRKSYEGHLASLREKIESGSVSISMAEEVKIDWWSSSSDTSYFSSSVRQSNPKWEQDLIIMKKRHEGLQASCCALGIDYDMIETKEYYSSFDSKSIKLNSTFQVPISMIVDTKEVDITKVKEYFQTPIFPSSSKE